MKTDYTREELISICERAVVLENHWLDRDSADSQRQIGECWALLKAGCEYKILTIGSLKTDEKTIWVKITFDGFAKFDWNGGQDEENYYLPTPERLEERKGGDWY
jgi:hypothetical protein